ncbi:hypothetical protein [Persephonella sp.]
MVRKSVNLRSEVAERISAIAKETGLSQTQVINLILNNVFRLGIEKALLSPSADIDYLKSLLEKTGLEEKPVAKTPKSPINI